MKGTFIVLEGGEGAGKSSTAQFLKTQVPNERFLFTREPGGTPLGELIRATMISPKAAEASAEAQLALAFAARFDHCKKVIAPALAQGVHVVSERFDSATYAYQIHGQEAPHLKPLFFECRELLGGCVPDLYILLDVEPSEGLRRAKGSGKGLDHFEQRNLAFHERVRAGLQEFLTTVPSVTVDANRPLEEVQKEVLSVIQKEIARFSLS